MMTGRLPLTNPSTATLAPEPATVRATKKHGRGRGI